MVEILLKKTLTGFAPVDDAGQELINSVGLGDIIKAKISRPRNVQHHRKFFALMNLVFENQERYEALDHMIAAVKTATGHSDRIQAGEKTIYLPRSIAFHKMDQTEFNAFYDRVLDLVAKNIIPGIDKEDLRSEVEGFMS